MNNIPSFAQSSVDATQVSLTITSLSKMVGALIVTYAALKGVDPMLATTNVQTVTDALQNIVAQAIVVLPALYAAYHSMKVIEGVFRKVGVRLTTLFSKKTPVATPVVAAPSTSTI